MTFAPDVRAIGLSEDEDPTFDKPWQAQAFAIVVELSASGAFTWKEWVAVFSEEIKRHPAREDETTNTAYYRQWLAALETIVEARGLAAREEVAARQEAWRTAYLNTPHGQPVTLRNALCAPSGVHSHAGVGSPIAISPAS